jgi:hypothetical protein
MREYDALRLEIEALRHEVSAQQHRAAAQALPSDVSQPSDAA